MRDFGNTAIAVNGCPAAIENPNAEELIQELLLELHNNPMQAGAHIQDYIAGILSKTAAIPYGKVLSAEEMRDLVDRLFACGNHNFSPDGKPVISIIAIDELEKRLK